VINKISPKGGRDIPGLVLYLFGPGRSNKHRDQRMIAADDRLEVADGTRLDQPHHQNRVRRLGRALDSHRVLAGVAPEGGWVWHCAISLHAGESLTDEQWAAVAGAVAARLGFAGMNGRAPCRWIAVAHGPSAGGNQHIHLAVNLVREDGTLAAPRPGPDRHVAVVCAVGDPVRIACGGGARRPRAAGLLPRGS